MRSSLTHYGKGWTFVVCWSRRQTAESETAVCACVCLVLEIQTRCTASRPETQDDNQEESLGLLSAGLKPEHICFFQENLLVFFSVRSQVKPSHFHLLKAAVFSEGAAPSAEHHPGRFMKVHVLYRIQELCTSHPNKILEKDRGHLKWCCFNVRLFCDWIMYIIYSFWSSFCAAASHTLWLFKQLCCLKWVCLKWMI